MRTLCILSVIILTITTGCKAKQNSGMANTKQENFTIININHYKAPCFTLGEMWCFLIKEDNDNDWSFFADQIIGFANYQWGYTYTLKVRKEISPEPPADAPAFRYVLVRVLSKKKADSNTTFPILLKYSDAKPFVRWEEENGFSILNDKPIECETKHLEEDLKSLILNEAAVEGTFRHSQKYDKLILISLKTK